MIYQLATRLRDLHALGYVHRDLKPGNVMWLPRENRWTIIDFGCVAKTGQPAKLGFSLAYAAPEVVSSFRNRERDVVAQVSFFQRHKAVHSFRIRVSAETSRLCFGLCQHARINVT